MGRLEGRIVASVACDGNGERGRMDLKLGASCAFERAALSLCLRSFLRIAQRGCQWPRTDRTR